MQTVSLFSVYCQFWHLFTLNLLVRRDELGKEGTGLEAATSAAVGFIIVVICWLCKIINSSLQNMKTQSSQLASFAFALILSNRMLSPLACRHFWNKCTECEGQTFIYKYNKQRFWFTRHNIWIQLCLSSCLLETMFSFVLTLSWGAIFQVWIVNKQPPPPPQ